MTELCIDTNRKTVRVRLDLLGEPTPVEIEITKYTLNTEGGAVQLTIEEATASREWLAVALREFVVGQALPLPPKASALLKLLT